MHKVDRVFDDVNLITLYVTIFKTYRADVAQLAEQLTCNQQVIGSSPIIGFFLVTWTFSSVG